MLASEHPLVIATHNPGKLKEIAELLAPLAIQVTSSGELGLPEPEENGDSFHENAAIKAESASALSGFPALADDSGLVVPALDGAPGIYSARWAGPTKDFTVAMEKIRQELAARKVNPTGTPAYFVCTLALHIPGQDTIFFDGEIHGILTFPPRGACGFGYDPIFIPEGDSRTFGEMPPAEKHEISHRAKAFELFIRWLNAQNPAQRLPKF